MFSACATSVLSRVQSPRDIAVSEPLDLTAEANPHNARQLRVRFEQWLRTLGAPTHLVDDLVLAVYEALANAVEHAYHPDHPDPVMRLQAHLDHDQLLITITDYGCWRTPGAPGYRGRGLAVMRSLSSGVHLCPSPQGTTVHMRADLPAAAAANRPSAP
jgi:anti-sigma regulatory factor (Ser/Thr protein kinase)